MHMIYFQNSIIYNEETIKESSIHYTANISRCLFSPQINYALTRRLPLFEFKKLLNVDELVKIHKKDNKYLIIVDPNIAELSNAFGYNFDIKEFSDFKTAEISANSWKINLRNVISSVDTFLDRRDDFLNGKKFIYNDVFPEATSDSFSEFIRIINENFNTELLRFEDFLFVKRNNKTNKSKFEKTNFSLQVQYLYNYKTARNFLKKLAIQKTEYFSSEEYTYHLKKIRDIIQDKENKSLEDLIEIKAYNLQISYIEEIFDRINISNIFNRKTFALICLLLEEKVQQEEAINNFIFKVLNNNLKYINIDENLNIEIVEN